MPFTTSDLTGRLERLAATVAAFPPEDRVPRPLVDPLSEIERWASKHADPDEHNRSCLDRIEDRAASNEETYHSMMGWYGLWTQTDHDERQEQAETRINESPLSLGTHKGQMHVAESWGGPADGYYVDVEDHDRVVGVTYYFQDWFDGATMDLDEHEYPWTWKYVSYFTELWTPEESDD